MPDHGDCLKETGRFFTVDEWSEAALELGLDVDDAGAISECADGGSLAEPGDAALRARLLEAVGLRGEAAG